MVVGQQKVKALRRYLDAYMTLMKDKPSPTKPFRKIYFDAFCGSGGRLPSETPLFEGEDLSTFKETSPRAALEVKPPFDEYYFCDLKEEFLQMLRSRLRSDGFDLRNCTFQVGDANNHIATFCASTNWRSTRCVMFLDPLGLQVDWATLERIAATGAIDLWYLFPSGIGLTRMTPRSGEIPPVWADRLTRLWGDESWIDVAYKSESDQLSFFERDKPRVEKLGDAVAFEMAFIARLKTIFGGVSENGLRLVNSRGSHMFSLLFACANEKPAAYVPALKIADHIIGMRAR